MVMAVNPPVAGRGKRFARRFRPNAEINVTPFVDVMLVLLIVFMVTAPLLTVGELVSLPQTASDNLPGDDEPLAVVIHADGRVRIQETEIPIEELRPRIQAIAGAAGMQPDERIYIYVDAAATAGDMLVVMSEIRAAGFTNMALPTDPLPGPSVGGEPDEQ
ncbi:MAG: biopolymer transporter ExbD [Maricaulaceae bacterium]|jgi:biopolymer transport protein TolR